MTWLLCCLSKESLWKGNINMRSIEQSSKKERYERKKESKSNKGEEKYVFKFLFWYVILYFKLHYITFLKVPKSKFPPILQFIHHPQSKLRNIFINRQDLNYRLWITDSSWHWNEWMNEWFVILFWARSLRRRSPKFYRQFHRSCLTLKAQSIFLQVWSG